MAVNLTGAEWNRFYADPAFWPDGAWHEDEEISIDGKMIDGEFDLSAVPEVANMTLSGGYVFWKDLDEGASLEEHFKGWRKQQTTTVLMVEVPHEAAEAVRAAIASAGGKVIA